jgi:Rrf2 family transcriptional regulator, iron-sulfur cluster assembly transcription factor
MILLPRRCVLAIAAVADIALNARPRPVAAKALASRHNLPPRHLETLLQSLVHARILKGVRGPHGGYELARERRKVSAGDIVRAAMTATAGAEEGEGAHSELIDAIVTPLVESAGQSFLRQLDTISVDDLVRDAEARTPANTAGKAEHFHI